MSIVLTDLQKKFGSKILLSIIGLSNKLIPRYQNCYLKDPSTIVIVTKNGGKRRICKNYYENIETQMGELVYCHDCPGCYQSLVLSKNPHFIFSYDDPINPVFAISEFKVPAKFQKKLVCMLNQLNQVSQQKIDFQAMLRSIFND